MEEGRKEGCRLTWNAAGLSSCSSTTASCRSCRRRSWPALCVRLRARLRDEAAEHRLAGCGESSNPGCLSFVSSPTARSSAPGSSPRPGACGARAFRGPLPASPSMSVSSALPDGSGKSRSSRMRSATPSSTASRYTLVLVSSEVACPAAGGVGAELACAGPSASAFSTSPAP